MSTRITTSSSSTASEAGDSEIEFHEASELTHDRIRQLETTLQRRVLRYFRRHGLLDEIYLAGMLTWQGSAGFSVDASVRLEPEDRAGIERLVRCCARPPSRSNVCTLSAPPPQD